MRIAFALPLILACGLAGAAAAQDPAASADNHAQTVSTAATAQRSEPAKAQNDNPEAAAALALSIRHREEEDQRIARIACAAGDLKKCPAAQTASQTVSPSSSPSS